MAGRFARCVMNADKYQKAIERLGDFGKLFIDYEGCPKGMMGRTGNSAIIEEVLAMPIIIPTLEVVEELAATERGNDGFGSSRR